MSARAPYGPSLERFVDCVCNVLPVGKVLSINKATGTCSPHHETGIDPRTVERYVTQYSNELNRSTNKKCGKEVKEECARKGFKITESLSGILQGQRRKTISGHQSHRGLSNVEQGGVCATGLGAESNERRQDFLQQSFRREISLEPALLLRRTEAHSYFHAKDRRLPRLVV